MCSTTTDNLCSAKPPELDSVNLIEQPELIMYNILQYHTVFLSAKTKATLMDFLPRTLNVKHSFYKKKNKDLFKKQKPLLNFEKIFLLIT